ncbi:MAG: hypothetical protein KC646_17420 [Candidatus Cloacimonetes bacterium]|nr:hypothetical protein [Candidatus Cloacimonadota bacterium]
MSQSGKTVHLQDYIHIVKKRFVFILFTILFTFSATFLLNHLLSPIYSAEVRLLIEEKLQDVNITRNSLLPFQEEFFDTQREIFESDPVFEVAVLELDLHNKVKKGSILTAIKARVKSLLGLDYDLSPEQKKRHSIENAIKGLRKQVFVEAVRGTNILIITAEDKDPVQVKKIVNSLAKSFVERSLYLKNKDTMDASTYLKGQLKSVYEKLTKSEDKLDVFQFTEEAISLDKRIEFLVEKQIIVAEKELEEVEVDLEEEREKVEVFHAQVGKERGKKSSGSFGTYKILKEQQLLLELKKNELRRKFTNQHPDVIAIAEQLSLLKSRISKEDKSSKKGEQQAVSEFLQSLEKEFSEAQRNYRVLSVRRDKLTSQIDTHKDKLKKLLNKKSDYLVLKRELTANEKLYELLLKKEKEVGIESTLKVGHVKIIQKASLPVFPIRPKKLLNLVASIFIGFFLGVGVAFFREYMDISVKTKTEIDALMGGYPLLGVFHEQEILKKEKHLLPSITFTNPNSMLGESFKILRQNVQFLMQNNQKTFMLTSSLPSEGKTTIATNLAITFAMSEKKVLLMDCDLRKPKIHNYFKTKPTNSGLLQTEVPGLYLFQAPKIENFGIYLESDEFISVLEEAKNEFDVILIDSAPVNLVSDTSSLIAQEIPLLFVVGSGHTTEEQLSRSLESLKILKSNVAGYIISRLEMKNIPKEYKAYYESYFSD